MLLDDEKATKESLRLVCGAGRQMGGGKGTSESMGLVCGAGEQMGATNESTVLEMSQLKQMNKVSTLCKS